MKKEDRTLHLFPFLVFAVVVMGIVLTPELGLRLLWSGVLLIGIGVYLSSLTKSSFPMHLVGAGLVAMAMLFGVALALRVIGR